MNALAIRTKTDNAAVAVAFAVAVAVTVTVTIIVGGRRTGSGATVPSLFPTLAVANRRSRSRTRSTN